MKDEELSIDEINEIIRKARAYDQLMEEEKNVSNHKDYWEMMDAIKTHSTEHKSQILPCDNPMQLKMGFICEKTEKKWFIRLGDVKKTWGRGKAVLAIDFDPQDPKSVDKKREELIKKAISTADGKMVIAAALSYKEE